MIMPTTRFSALVRNIRRQKDTRADLFETTFFFRSDGNDGMIMSRCTPPLSKEIFVDKSNSNADLSVRYPEGVYPDFGF